MSCKIILDSTDKIFKDCFVWLVLFTTVMKVKNSSNFKLATGEIISVCARFWIVMTMVECRSRQESTYDLDLFESVHEESIRGP